MYHTWIAGLNGECCRNYFVRYCHMVHTAGLNGKYCSNCTTKDCQQFMVQMARLSH